MSNGQIQIPFPYTTLPPTHIKALVQKIRTKLNVTTHKKKFTKYDNSFVGCELVSWLVKSKAVPTRRDAMQICLRLFEARLIIHVKNNEMFKDDKELYHLIDPVAGSRLTPNESEVKKARAYIQNRGVPKHESGYKQLIKVLSSKGMHLSEISRAITMEKYGVKESNFPKTKINKQSTDMHSVNRTNHNHIQQLNIPTPELLKVRKKIIGILKYAFLAADQSRSNDLDLKEFEYLLDRLGIKVSTKGAELLFRAMLSQHNKRFLGFYEFKMAFMVSNPLQFIQTQNDLHPAKVLRRHIRKYYENVAEAHKANRKKLAEIAWGLFNYDKTKTATMNLSEFTEGIKYLGLDKLSQSEIEFIFKCINASKTGMVKKEEFTHSVKKDIPVSIGKVVNVKEILFDTFERILTDYSGVKTSFPKRVRHKSVVSRGKSTAKLKSSEDNPEKPPVVRKKKSIFQRMRYKSKRKKTIKATVTTPFGSNLAEMADTGNNMMNDIILSMVTEDDVTVDRKDDDIITADEFRQLFSQPFYPQSVHQKEEENKKKKPINIIQLSMLNKGIKPPPEKDGNILNTTAMVISNGNEPNTVPLKSGKEMSGTKTSRNKRSTLGTVGTDTHTPIDKQSSVYESEYSEIFPDIYPPHHDHTKSLDTYSNAANLASPTLNPEYIDKHQNGGQRIIFTPSTDYAFEDEEEKQSTRVRTQTGDSLLDLNNSKDFDKAMRLKKNAMANIKEVSENGSYSPPPPTLLSVDVGVSPPFMDEDTDFGQFQNDSGSDLGMDNGQQFQYAITPVQKRTQNDSNLSSVIVKSGSQAMNSRIKSEIDSYGMNNGYDIPYNEYNEYKEDEIDCLSQDEHEQLDLHSQDTGTRTKMSTLILPDDILNESDEEMSANNSLYVEVSPMPGNVGTAQSSLSPIPAPHEIAVPPNMDRRASKQSAQSIMSTPSVAMTRVSNMTPSSYTPALDKLQNVRQLHNESLHQNEEDGLSYYDENGLFNYKKGRDGAFAQYIGNLNPENEAHLNEMDESISESDDSLRQLQVQYQREQLLPTGLQAALFNESNIDDYDDPHPKDMHLYNASPEQVNIVVKSKNYTETDLADSNSAVERKKSLKPSVAKRISRGNSPVVSNNNESKYDQLFDAIDLNDKSQKKRRHSKSKSKPKIRNALDAVFDEMNMANNDELNSVDEHGTLPQNPLNRPKSIPYTTPAQLTAIQNMVHTHSDPNPLANDVSQLVGGSDDDIDPGAPGTANLYSNPQIAWQKGTHTSSVIDIAIDVESSHKSNISLDLSEGHSYRKPSVEDVINSELNVTDFMQLNNTEPIMESPVALADKVRKSCEFDTDELEQKQLNNNPPQMTDLAIQHLKKSLSDLEVTEQKAPAPHKPLPTMNKTDRKLDKFMSLPPIPGVITLKKVVCKNIAKGKMKAQETYYLRVYQGKCESVESNNAPTKKLPVMNTNHSSDKDLKTQPRLSAAAKLKQLKAKKFALPPSKKLGALPKLTVIKSYPVFCKQSQACVTWQNLPASITKDAKTLTVGIYMKRERELVLIGSKKLVKSKKHLIPKPRIGVKNTSVVLTLDVPERFEQFQEKSVMEVTYSFCPKQFNVDIRVLQSTKLPIYPSKIPVCIQLIRFHLLKVTQEISVSDMEDDDEYSDTDSENESEMHTLPRAKSPVLRTVRNKNGNKFYNKRQPSKQLINSLVGDMNSGHYKFEGRDAEIVWHGLLRWFREIQPFPVLSGKNISVEFVNGHSELTDDDFALQLIALLNEPYSSLFLWCIDFLIEMSSWYTLKLNIENAIIDWFVPTLFGVDYINKPNLFLTVPNAYSFVLRAIDLRNKKQLN